MRFVVLAGARHSTNLISIQTTYFEVPDGQVAGSSTFRGLEILVLTIYTVLHIFTQFGLFMMKMPMFLREGGGALPLAFQYLNFII